MRKDNDKRVYLMDDSTDVVYLKNVIDDPEIQVGEHTYYHDFFKDPRDFLKNNILYHFPGFGDQIVIGKYCSIACGTKFLCPIANHSFTSLANYPFPIVPDHWELGEEDLAKVAQWKGPTTVGNDVWFGFESLIMPGVTIGDGAIIGSRSVVTKDVPPYTVVAGSPARVIRKRFDDTTIDQLLALKWWDLPDEQVKEIVPAIMAGDIDAVLERKWLSDAVREVVARIGAQGKE